MQWVHWACWVHWMSLEWSVQDLCGEWSLLCHHFCAFLIQMSVSTRYHPTFHAETSCTFATHTSPFHDARLMWSTFCSMLLASAIPCSLKWCGPWSHSGCSERIPWHSTVPDIQLVSHSTTHTRGCQTYFPQSQTRHIDSGSILSDQSRRLIRQPELGCKTQILTSVCHHI